MTLPELSQYFSSCSHMKDFHLQPGVFVADGEKFVTAHLSMLYGAKTTKTKRRFLPYYNRLIIYKTILDNEQTKQRELHPEQNQNEA